MTLMTQTVTQNQAVETLKVWNKRSSVENYTLAQDCRIIMLHFTVFPINVISIVQNKSNNTKYQGLKVYSSLCITM